MLAIRLQRVGRSGYATYRVAVQEAQRHPLSGRVVAYVGTYNPHTKDVKIQVELAQKYLDNGAQPSPRVVKLLADAGVKLPKWVEKADKKTSTIKNTDKLRKNQPAKEVVETPAIEEPVEEVTEPTEEVAEPVVEAEAPVESETSAEPVVEEAVEPEEIAETDTEETA